MLLKKYSFLAIVENTPKGRLKGRAAKYSYAGRNHAENGALRSEDKGVYRFLSAHAHSLPLAYYRNGANMSAVVASKTKVKKATSAAHLNSVRIYSPKKYRGVPEVIF